MSVPVVAMKAESGHRRPLGTTAQPPACGATAEVAGGPGLLTAAGICKQYGRNVVLRGVGLTVPTGSIVALLGPSGSGKTTLGEVLAGTVRCDQGRILNGDQDITRAPAHLRGIALAPQEWELFPHLTVVENIAFGLWAAGVSNAERTLEAREWIARVGLAGRETAIPSQLSGGQQQRIALARALAAKGPFVVLDEPFANVDQETRGDLRRLVCEEASRGRGIVLITHDRDDALMLANTVVCLHGGRVVVQGSAEDVYWRPGSLEAARLTGEADLVGLDDWGTIPPGVEVPAGPDPKALSLIVRPEWLELAGDDQAQIVGVATDSSYRGADFLVGVRTRTTDVHVRSLHPMPRGQSVGVRVREGVRIVAIGPAGV